MDGFKAPDKKDVKLTPDGYAQPPGLPVNDGVAKAAAESLAETEADTEADEAVVAGVAAVGGIALRWHHFKQFFVNWWRNKKSRYWTLGSLAVILIVVLAVPFTRYGILNALGIDATVTVRVLDGETSLPLKQAKVTLGGAESESGEDGRAKLYNVNLGSQEFVISKAGYGDHLAGQTVNLGGNDYGDVSMIATGTRLAFNVKDWLSGQAITEVQAEVSNIGANASGDAQGLVRLVIPPTDSELNVEIGAKGYRNQIVKVDPANTATIEVKLVADGWHAFVSNRDDGDFDLYRAYLDGSNQEKVLSGTGDERKSSLALLTSPDGHYAAFVSTRDGERNKDGYVLSGLYIVNLDTKENVRADLAESINLVGWVDNRLSYRTVVAGESGASPDRSRIKSFVIGGLTGENLISSNYFSDVILANGRIYYAPALSYKQTEPREYLYSMGADGSDRRTHIDEQTWTIARSDADTLVVNTAKGSKNYWYELDLDSITTTKLSGQPASFEYYNTYGDFAESQDGKLSAWVDSQDGQEVVKLKSANGQTKVLWRGVGAKTPIHWVDNNYVIFRADNQGIVDYIINVNGGEALKLGEVTDVVGVQSGSGF